VIAGYPWFGDWGRDTMIAMPGLALVTGRYDVAKSILLAFAGYVDRGMLPNRFPDAGEAPEYNTVDATLWFFEATRALAARTGDYEFVRTRLYDVLADIIRWHERGTRYGIHVDSDGLLMAGEPGVQLTWMDAKVGDWVVTPRIGKPVEIQALWYNALRVMEEFARKFGRESDGAHYRELADRAQRNFPELFWNESAGCLCSTRCFRQRLRRALSMWWSGICSRRMDCEVLRQETRSTTAATKAIRSAGTVRIIRGRSGRG
jgi:predicted glycogen debranching enzyme